MSIRKRPNNRRCPLCDTILSDANSGPNCFTHQDKMPNHEMNSLCSLAVDTGSSHQVERMMYKVHVEVARAFGTTVLDLQRYRDDDHGHLSVVLIVIELFGASHADLCSAIKIVGIMDITTKKRHPDTTEASRQIQAAKDLFASDDVFRKKYTSALDALKFIDPDILPYWAPVPVLNESEASKKNYEALISAMARTRERKGRVRR